MAADHRSLAAGAEPRPGVRPLDHLEPELSDEGVLALGRELGGERGLTRQRFR